MGLESIKGHRMPSELFLSKPSVIEKRSLIKEAIFFNTGIFCLLIFKPKSAFIPLIGGLIIIVYITFSALRNPVKAVFLFMGIKLTFDALWETEPFLVLEIGKLGLLELFIIPVIYLALFGPKIKRETTKLPFICAIVYIAWIILATLLNKDSSLDVSLLGRQSSLLFGLILGMKYIKDLDEFNTVIYLVFCSTIIPVLVSLSQIVIGSSVNLNIFHYKLVDVRDFRYSGLYYDPATMGMISVLSLLCNLYLLRYGIVERKYKLFHLFFILGNILVTLSGGTRSVISVSLLLVIVFLITNLRKAVFILPLVLLITFISKPYIEGALLKTEMEIPGKLIFREMLLEPEYRIAFTGRVGIWQDIWERFNAGSILEKLFGSGLSSNAHSSYFFLLLQIGLLGLMFYILFLILLSYEIFKRKISRSLKLVAVFSLISVSLIGLSASTVTYTSFQWIVFFIAGVALAIETSQ